MAGGSLSNFGLRDHPMHLVPAIIALLSFPAFQRRGREVPHVKHTRRLQLA